MISKHVFARHSRADLPMVASGDGPWLIDTQGHRYLDASGGAAVSCLGHTATPVINAVKTQLDAIAYAHTGFFTSEPAEALAEALATRAPEGIERVYFVSGGSEAVESALKLARQYYLEIGQPERVNIIARRQSYHGNTLGALSTGGNDWRRQPFTALLSPAMHHIDPCHYYRYAEPGETPEAYAVRSANALEAKIQQLGPETVAAFVAEPVVGATMGAVSAEPGYFQRIREICDQYGVLLILDEVMCGMGRTGSLFACDQEPVRPDILCIAKGLGAGIQPIGAMLCHENIHDAIAQGSGFFQHGHTYIGHPCACAAGLAVLHTLEDQALLANVNAMGKALDKALRERFSNHPNVGDIRGRGLFRGLELVADKNDKSPLAPARGMAGKIKAAAMREGLMCYPMDGTIDGKSGDHILLAPPFIIDDTHVELIVERLGKALDLTLDA
ncbi:MAG TPA: aspartate aminotransferase family protein [Gammaproteobacteria bacterium]|jgi:adenosylmethionine-8-amino-7-oxononanoate aminotransferase|nr:aspartate aminotransferase family protein [Gammaproteobacteria bacterium]